MLCGCGCVAAPEACGCRPGQRVFVCVVLALHGAFDVVEDARGSKRCAHVGVVHVEVSSVGLFARSALRVCPGSNDDRVLGNRLAGALIYPVRVGNARLNGRGGFLVCVFFLTLRPFLVESVYVLGGFNPFGDARQVEVSAVVLLGGVVPFLPAQEVFTQEHERVVVEVQGCALVGGERVKDVALVPFGAGAQSALICGNSVVAHGPVVSVACHDVFSPVVVWGVLLLVAPVYHGWGVRVYMCRGAWSWR